MGPQQGCNQHFHQVRLLMVALGGVAMGMMLFMRFNISVAILKMVRAPVSETPKASASGQHLAELDEDRFEWNNQVQQMIMTWYMFSYSLPQIYLTRLCLRIGQRLSMVICLSVCSVSSLLTPLVAHLGWQWVLGLRLINGFGAAAVVPLLISLVEVWMPGAETSLGMALGQTVQILIMCSTPLVCGILCDRHWSLAFYVPALITLAFCVLWLVLVADSPEQSWLISSKELLLIQTARIDQTWKQPSHSQLAGKISASGGALPDPPPHRLPVPASADKEQAPVWTTLFEVPSLYYMCFLWILDCTSTNSFIFVLPTYLQQVLDIPITKTGSLCFIIETGCLLSMIWPHLLLQLLQRKLRLSPTGAQRITYSTCCLPVALTWFYIALYHQNQTLVLFLNRYFQDSNELLIPITLICHYGHLGLSSVAFSMINTVSNLFVIASSTSLGWLLDYTSQSLAGWSLFYNLAAGSQVLMLLVFVLCIDADTINLGHKPSTIARADNLSKQASADFDRTAQADS